MFSQANFSLGSSIDGLPKIVLDSLNATFLDSTTYSYSFDIQVNYSVLEMLNGSQECLFEISMGYLQYNFFGHRDEYNVGIGLYAPLVIYEIKADGLIFKISRSRFTPEVEWRCIKHVFRKRLSI